MKKPSRKNRRKQAQFRRHTEPGSAPGQVVVDPAARQPVTRVIAYDRENLIDRTIENIEEIRGMLGKSRVTWVNVDGLGSAEVIKKLGEIFHLHPLALEDVVHVHQRPKVEQYGEHVFIVARMACLEQRLETEQVSIFLGADFVLTFLEDPGDSFDPVRARLKAGHARARDQGAGYLAYALLDAIVDAYFPIVEEYGDRLDDLEDDVILRPERNAIARVHDAKRDLRTLRRAVWPLREAINGLIREPTPLLSDETRVYLRDCYDHTVQIIDLVETYRELGADLSDLYLSGLSNRMNEVMKVLTIISTIFIPLSFIAGVYGMNFDTQASSLNMPELKWRWGYPFSLALMASVTAAMLAFFIRRGWLRALSPTGTNPPAMKDEG